MTTISDCYIQCSGSFSRLIKSLGTSTGDINEHIPLKGIANEYSRFDVWAGSIGAKHVPHKRISLDYRLRDSSFYAARVVDILQRLNSTLNTADDLIGKRPLAEAAEVAQVAQPKLDRQRDNDSDRSSIVSSAESSSSDEADMMTPKRQITALYESITSSVRHLYSLAMVIRQPVAIDRLSRASKITVDHFLSVDQRHVDECFPDASPVLKKRLAKAITRRRQLLIYNEQHYRKSSESQPSKETIASGDLAQHSSKDKGIEQNVQPPLASSDYIEHPAKEAPSYAPTLSKNSLMASTEATRFVTPVDMREEPDVQSESGTISTFGFNGKDRVGIRVPPRPQDDDGEALEQFLCPLCYHLIEVKSERAWTRHVFRDLQAYMCTFDNCESPDVFFETRQDWVRHEFENHRREWHCNDSKHDPCNSETEFIAHMKGLHELRLPEPELLSLAKLCERSSSAEAFICPLCKEGSHDVSNGFQSFKPSWIMRPVVGFTCPESYDSERLDMAKLPDGIFSNTTENTFPRVIHWVASLPSETAMQGDMTADSPSEPQQMYPTIGQQRHYYIPSSDFKRHVGQHLERLALFALNRSKFMIDDGKSACTENAIARSETSFESRQSFNSMNSDENHGHGQIDPADTLDSDSEVDEIGRLEARYQMADLNLIELQETRRLINETLIKSEFEYGQPEAGYSHRNPRFFCPEGSLSRIVTLEAVLWAFCDQGEVPSKIDSEALKSTVTYTLERGKKLFAISAMSEFRGKSLRQAMQSFETNNICDDNLPLSVPDLRNVWKYLPDLGRFDHIQSKQIDRFCNDELQRRWTHHTSVFCTTHQWKFCVPVFREGTEVGHLHRDCILPFTKKCDKTNEDSYGQAIKYKIHKRHLVLNDLAIYKPAYVTATRLSFDPMWQCELVKLKRIQALNQKHVVKLITTFRHGEKDFYFLSEASGDGNLKRFWETFPRVLTVSLIKSVTQQLLGLVRASFEVGLTTGLIEGNALVSNHNLNPENILWFKDGSGAGRRIGTMKSCHQSGATELVPNTSLPAQLYRPPEDGVDSWYWRRYTDDMWATGCITLEFIIWLLYGNAGLNKFHGDPEFEIPGPDFKTHFWQSSTNGRQVHPVVSRWMGYMARDPVCRAGHTALGDLLKLTRDRLLVVDVAPRSDIDSMDFEDDSGPSCQEVDIHRLQNPADGPVVKTDSELWKEHRGLIMELYVQENKRIEEIKDIMKTDHGFHAPRRKYQQQLDKWLFGEDTLQRRRGLEQVEGDWYPESITPYRARPKEVCDWMNRILSGAKGESYWLPCPPLPLPDVI